MKILMTVTIVVCSIAVCSRSAAAEDHPLARSEALAAWISADGCEVCFDSLRRGDGDLYAAGWRSLEPSGTSRLPTSATTIASGTP